MLRVPQSLWLVPPTEQLSSPSPSETLLVTGLHRDHELLPTALPLQPSSQSCIHWVLHPSNPHLSSSDIRMPCGNTLHNSETLPVAPHSWEKHLLAQTHLLPSLKTFLHDPHPKGRVSHGATELRTSNDP